MQTFARVKARTNYLHISSAFARQSSSSTSSTSSSFCRTGLFFPIEFAYSTRPIDTSRSAQTAAMHHRTSDFLVQPAKINMRKFLVEIFSRCFREWSRVGEEVRVWLTYYVLPKDSGPREKIHDRRHDCRAKKFLDGRIHPFFPYPQSSRCSP